MEIKDVENLAELAKIDLNEDEKKQILKDMGSILKYVKTIESVKVPARNAFSTPASNASRSDLGWADAGGDEIDPKYDIYNVWREDKIETREFSKDSIIKQFPDSQDNFLKVKKIL